MSIDLGTIDTSLGRTKVTHRLALAVAPLDAVTQRPVPPGVRVGRETLRSLARSAPLTRRPSDPQRLAVPVRTGAGAYVVAHDASTPLLPPPDRPPGSPPMLTVRVTDPACRWVARRLRVELWTLDEAQAPDKETPDGPFIPAASRSIRPWLLPGGAYPFAGGVTGARLLVLRDGNPARWAEVEVFDGTGQRLAWGHGDEHGQVLLLLDRLGPGLPTGPVSVAVRVHLPDDSQPAVPPADIDADPLADLVVEDLPRQAVPAGSFTDDASLGVAVPAGYVTASADVVRAFVPGRVVAFPDVPFIP